MEESLLGLACTQAHAAVMCCAATQNVPDRWGLSQSGAALCTGSDSALVGHLALVAAQQDFICD